MELEVCVCGGLAGAERGSIPLKAASLMPTTASRLRSTNLPIRKTDGTSYGRVSGTQRGWITASQRLLPFVTLILLPMVLYFAITCRFQGGTLSILCHRFAETKDASIVERAVELNGGPEGKEESKGSFTPHVQIPVQLEKPPVSENDTDKVSSEGVKESPHTNQGSVVITQILPEVKESEQLTQVEDVESSLQKETNAYVVRAEPKVVDVKRADVKSSDSEFHLKVDSEENVTKEEKSVLDVILTDSLPQDSVKSENKIKVEGHPEESGTMKDEASMRGEYISTESASPSVPDTEAESPTPPPSASASEDMPSFSEWTQKRLEEAERRKVLNDTVSQSGSDGSIAAAPHSPGSSGSNSNAALGPGGSSSSPASGSSSSKNAGEGNVGMVNTVSGGSKVRQKNYASPDCGAKIASSNPEAVSPGSVLSPSRDEYLLNACASRIWFVVELCEAIRAKKIDLANFELFSSSPREFSVWSSDRFPTRDWSLVGRFIAQDERTLQSFHLDPHLYAKFIRVELHSHYGSEHFCPVSLFRVYGTSEFEVLETEQEDGVNGVIGSGDSSGSLGGDNSGEDSDEEEPLDIETSGPPRNLFGSARDAVMSIVKKAAEALVKAGDSANETITLATESPIKEVPKNEASEPTSDGEETESAFSPSNESAECRTLRRPPVCEGCEEATILRAAALLSCHYDTLRPLTSSPFVRSALASGGLCTTRFGLPLSAANPSSSTPATDGGYISALLPVEYLVALCNALITPDMLRESDTVILPELSLQPAYSGESHTQSPLPEPNKHQTEGPMTGDSSVFSSMIKPTRTLKGDVAGSRGCDESVIDAVTPDEVSAGVVTGSTIVEVPQSTSMPSFSSMTSSSSFHDIEEASASEEEAVNTVSSDAASTAKQESVEPCKDLLEKESEPGFHESIEYEVSTAVPPVMESVTGAPISSVLSPSASTPLPLPLASATSTHSSSEGLASQGSPPLGAKGAEDSISVPTPSPSVPTPVQGHSKAQEAANIPAAVPTAAVMQKESVFVRLSNRIKTLERNMSLSAQYLEELSRRYRKQFEEAQKQSIEAQKRDRRLAEDAASLQARLDVLAEAVQGLLEARKREEEERKKEMEEEAAKRREEDEYGENFPWWGSILLWTWNAAGKAAVTVAQHAVIFCIELIFLWAVMGHYNRRRWGWLGGAASDHLEAESHQVIDGDIQDQLKYASIRKRRKWIGGLKEDDWIESTESGRSPRKRKPTNEDLGLDTVASTGLPSPELNYQPHQKQKRRRRKLKSSSTVSLSSCPSPVTFPLPSDSQLPVPHSAIPITQQLDAELVENLNGWTWPCGDDVETTEKASVIEEEFHKTVTKEDPVNKAGYSGRNSPKSNADETKEGLGKVKSRRVSAPVFFHEDSGTTKKNVETTSPLSRSSSQIHSSLRVCSPKLKGDNWEWFTGARVSGDLNSRSSRPVNRNGHSAIPSGDGASGNDRVEGQAGNSSSTPSGSGKNKDKKGGSSGSGGGGSSFKKIVKRFF